MAANSNGACARLFDLLTEVYRLSLIRNREVELVVKDCRQLLKPWPQEKDVPSEKTEKKEGVEQGSVAVQQEDDAMTEAERAALEMAEKALAQAHRLRQKQAKVLERETNYMKEKAVDALKAEADLKQADCSTKRESDTLRTTKNDKEQKNELKHETATVGLSAKQAKQPVVNSSKLQKNLKSPSLPAGRSSRMPTGRSTGSKPLPARTTDKVVKSAPSTVPRVAHAESRSQRPSSVNTVKSTHRPAHMTAPFKTQAPIDRTARKGRPTRTSVLRQNQVDRQKAGGSQPVKSSLRTKQQGDHNAEMGRKADHASEVPLAESLRALTVNEDAHQVSHVEWEEEHPVEEPPTAPVAVSLSVCEQLDGACDDPPPAEPALFNLLTDGHKLTVPGKLRKALATNNKLRHQVEKAAMTVHASRDGSPMSLFLNRLSEHYESVTSKEHCDTVQMGALYKKLCGLMNCLQRKKIDEGSTWHEVLHVKRTVENICLLFADMEGRFNELATGYKSEAPVPVLDTPPDLSPGLWLPSRYLSEDVRLPSTIKYRRLRDLDRYVRLVHEVQLLHLRLRVMEVTSETVLPLLQLLNDDCGYFHVLYRAVFSLLCSSGTRQPVIISDAINDPVD